MNKPGRLKIILRVKLILLNPLPIGFLVTFSTARLTELRLGSNTAEMLLASP